MNTIYTGRDIAILTDDFGMLVPLEAILLDMKKRGIKDIYSLGNAIGYGPNSDMVISLFEEYNVKAIAGIMENYIRLGYNSFGEFNHEDLNSCFWLKNMLGIDEINFINSLPNNIDINIGNKNISLCSFAYDVRLNSSYIKEYINNFKPGISCEMFFKTNSEYLNKSIIDVIDNYYSDHHVYNSYRDVYASPLFDGKTVDNYDSIIQGSTGMRLFESFNKINFHSFAPVCFNNKGNIFHYATYYILKEKKCGGFDIQTVVIPYNFDKMKSYVLDSKEPNEKVKKMILKK